MISWFFRLPSVVYFGLAGAAVVLGIVVLFLSQADDADRAAALKHEPPAEVALDDLQPLTYKSDYDEIVIRGQAHLESIMESVKTKRSREVGRTLYMPIFPLAAEDVSGLAKAVVVIDGTVSDEQLAAFFVEEGKIGPVVSINGLFEQSTSMDAGDARDALNRVTKLERNFIVVKPFMNGREVDLAPQGMGWGFLIFGLVAAAALAGFGLYRRGEEGGSYRDSEDGYIP